MPRNYDDLMGLDMYDDLDQFVTPSMVRDSLIAAGAGAGAILIASWVTPYLPAPADWDEANKHRMRAGVATIGGWLVGRLIWDYNRDAAMAVMGGVMGLGIAQFVDTFFDLELVGNPLGVLPEDVELSGDEALLSAYDQGQAMMGLETTGVTTSAPAFGNATVTPEELMALEGTVVQAETLGYQPYLS